MTNQRTVYFEDYSWWDDPGCSCCEGVLMECWNCEEEELIPHSVHSLEEARASVASALGLIEDDREEDYSDKDIDKLLKDNNIEVVLESDELSDSEEE